MSVSFLLSFGAAELAYSLYLKKDQSPTRSSKETFDCWQYPSEVINNLRPNCKANWKKVVNGEVVFDVEVSTNENGLRNTDKSKTKSGNDDLVLFFGASNVYGHGLPDDKTIPSMFHQMTGVKNIYNYGGGGFGPQHMLYALEENDIKNKIKYSGNGRKAAFYFFSDGQVTSAIGNSSVISGQSGEFPYYRLNSNNILVREGMLKDRLSSQLILLASKSKLMSKFIYWLEEKTDYSPKNVDYTIQFAIQAANKFKEHYGSDEFYLVFTPVRSVNSRERAKEVLQKHNIKYFDYTDFFTGTTHEYRLHPLDSHFSALANKLQTEQLVKDAKF
jgi:hypothetical protein